MLHITESASLTPVQKEAILRLWNNEYPGKLGYESMEGFDAYLISLTGRQHYLLSDNEDHLNGWAFTFSRNSEKWFAIILDTAIQHKGFGTMLLNHIKTKESVLNGWVIDHNNDLKNNGAAYVSKLGFYLKNGFVLCPDTRLETEQLSAVKIAWQGIEASVYRQL